MGFVPAVRGLNRYRGEMHSWPGGDYAEVARLLIAAGDPMKDCNTPTGNEAVDAVLRKHKLIH